MDFRFCCWSRGLAVDAEDHAHSEWIGPRMSFRPGLAVSLLIACVVLMVNAWPMRMPVYSSHDGTGGYRPYQDLIDQAVEGVRWCFGL